MVAIKWDKAVSFAGVAFPILLVCYFVFVTPRPYYVTEMDSEQDYYYNAKLILHGGRPLGIHHPGTPIYYLGAALLALVGEKLESTQDYFDLAHFTAALIFATSIALFSRLVRPTTSRSGLALCLAAIVVWPPMIQYLDFFGADSFIFAPGLILIAIVWRKLHRPLSGGLHTVALMGAVAGLCLSIKLTFIPLVIAIAFGLAVHGRLSVRKRPGSIRRQLAPFRESFVFVTSCSLAFLLFTLPVLAQTDVVLGQLLFRSDTRPGAAGAMSGLLTVLSRLISAAPGAMLLAILCALMGLLGMTRELWSLSRPGPGLESELRTTSNSPPDWLSAWVIGVTSIIAFLYTCSASATISPGADPGIQLRNISPSYLGVPFMLLVGGSYFSTSWKLPHASRLVTVVTVLVVAGAAAFGLFNQLASRSDRIAIHERRIEAVIMSLNTIDQSEGRMGFWTESHQDYLGPISFHWWGNYRYARGEFSEDLAAAYPRYMFFSIRNLWRSAVEAGSIRRERPPSRWGWPGEQWRAFERRLAVGHRHEEGCILLPCGTNAQDVSVILFPIEEYDELRGLGRKVLERWVIDSVGRYESRELQTLDIQWEVWEIDRDRVI